MMITKRAPAEAPREDAHDGAGGRRLCVRPENVANTDWPMAYGYLPGGSSFDWQRHHGAEEVMLVIRGAGTASDPEGRYPYAPGDVFVFPSGIEHRIDNPSHDEHEYVFVRLRTRMPVR